MATTLLVAPQIEETEALIGGFNRRGHQSCPVQIGTIECAAIPSLDLAVAVGGHGKTQFAVHTQHLIDHSPDTKYLFCIGSAGCLTSTLSLGDIVVGTSTVEHDYKLRFIREPLPRHQPDIYLLQEFRKVARTHTFPFNIHFGPIASGDEDVVDSMRARELRIATEGLCVAWEGSGGARAAAFSELAFLEVRCVTDGAGPDAAASFRENLIHVMPNIADLLICWHELIS